MAGGKKNIQNFFSPENPSVSYNDIYIYSFFLRVHFNLAHDIRNSSKNSAQFRHVHDDVPGASSPDARAAPAPHGAPGARCRRCRVPKGPALGIAADGLRQGKKTMVYGRYIAVYSSY